MSIKDGSHGGFDSLIIARLMKACILKTQQPKFVRKTNAPAVNTAYVQLALGTLLSLQTLNHL